MSFSRSSLLWMSRNELMNRSIPKLWFIQKALKKFMPGENVDDALEAAQNFSSFGIHSVFTKLGENITDLSNASEVKNHYLDVIDKIADSRLDVELSVKLTQLGFDFSLDDTINNFIEIAERAKQKLNNSVFIDMEGSSYTQRTIEFYKIVKSKCDNSGLCLQAYLRRTENDLNELFQIFPSIRLVKGAYMEPAEIAFPEKHDVDINYFVLAKKFLEGVKINNNRVIFATHDEKLINRIIGESKKLNLPADKLEFQMLYGIKTALQKKIADEGYKIRVLISYGKSWYPWYMRRLAERPANIWFVLKNIF